MVPGNPSSATHTYADGPATFTITATATDEDGTFAAGKQQGAWVIEDAKGVFRRGESPPIEASAREA